jgi:spermidine/putrescine transport system ATP-binding protein
MDRGRIEQDDAPERVYRQPATAFVAEFMGDCNRLEVRVLGRARQGDHWEVELAGGQRLTASGPVPGGAVTRAIAFIRPEHVVLLKHGAASAEGSIVRGRTRHRVFLGPYTRLDVELDGGQQLGVHSPNPAEGHLAIEPGDPVELRVSPQAVRLLPIPPAEKDPRQET